MFPYCTSNGSLTLDPTGAGGGIQGQEQFARNFGSVYALVGFITVPICCFVLSIFCRPPLIKHSCYKLMALTTLLDIINLTNATIIPGFLSIQNIHHCNSGYWVSYVTQSVMYFWLCYSCASQVLALNRMLEFSSKNMSDFLFEGKRIYVWFVVVLLYPVAGAILVPDKFYFYNTYGGYWAQFRRNGEPNMVLVINNFFKPAFLTVAYALMLIFIYRRLKMSGAAKVSMFQVKVSVQTLVIAVLADFASIGYVVISWVPFSPELAPYAGNVGQFLWISLHAGTGIIYAIMNGAVNRRIREVFCGATQVLPSEVTHTDSPASGLSAHQPRPFLGNIEKP
ncbi:hypothetical protein QR680_006810 [Steinernema hermaphroditum]|uniref:Uncharacterized protein n=1 Tax=Steinernema hermaphroditum TaxID=289476 RepID=A0AA39HXT7_9BILA|nr:hypothetical protein QR680_006810 [Steinernema hermaphroditum]